MKFLLFLSFVFFTVFSYSQVTKIVARKDCPVTDPCPGQFQRVPASYGRASKSMIGMTMIIIPLPLTHSDGVHAQKRQSSIQVLRLLLKKIIALAGRQYIQRHRPIVEGKLLAVVFIIHQHPRHCRRHTIPRHTFHRYSILPPSPRPTPQPPLPPPPACTCDNPECTPIGTPPDCACECGDTETNTCAECPGEGCSQVGIYPNCRCECIIVDPEPCRDCGGGCTQTGSYEPNCSCSCPPPPCTCADPKCTPTGVYPNCGCSCPPPPPPPPCTCADPKCTPTGVYPNCGCNCPPKKTPCGECGDGCTQTGSYEPNCSCSCPPETCGECGDGCTQTGSYEPNCSCSCPPPPCTCADPDCTPTGTPPR